MTTAWSSAASDNTSGPTYVAVRECLRLAWRETRQHFASFLVVVVAMVLASLVFVVLTSLVTTGPLHQLLWILQFLAPWLVSFALFHIALGVVDGVPGPVRQAWAPLRCWLAFIIACLILVIPVAIITAATFGVGLLLGLPMLLFYPFFAVDRGSRGRSSIRQSWTAGAIHYNDAFRLALCNVGLLLLGVITIVGWVFTVPMVVVATAHAYRTATGPPGPWS